MLTGMNRPTQLSPGCLSHVVDRLRTAVAASTGGKPNVVVSYGRATADACHSHPISPTPAVGAHEIPPVAM